MSCWKSENSNHSAGHKQNLSRLWHGSGMGILTWPSCTILSGGWKPVVRLRRTKTGFRSIFCLRIRLANSGRSVFLSANRYGRSTSRRWTSCRPGSWRLHRRHIVSNTGIPVRETVGWPGRRRRCLRIQPWSLPSFWHQDTGRTSFPSDYKRHGAISL